MTRLVEAGTLVPIALQAVATIEVARALAEALDRPAAEIVVLDEVIPGQMLDTYRDRLQRWKSGEGPECLGLEHFVGTLEMQESSLQAFFVKTSNAFFIGLVDDKISELIDATTVKK